MGILIGEGMQRLKRYFDQVFRVDRLTQVADVLHIRAVAIMALVFIFAQLFNLAYLTAAFGTLTHKHMVAAIMIIISCLALMSLRYVKSSIYYALLVSATLLGGVSAVAIKAGVGIDTALLPALVVGVVANSFLGHWRLNLLYSAGAVGLIWYLYTVSVASPVPANVNAAVLADMHFMRASQTTLAVTLATVISSFYSYMSEREFRRLDEMKARLEAAEQSRVECLANISHELCTPLNGILGIGEMLTQSDLSPKDREYVDLIYANSEMMTELVSSMMTFTQSELGTLVLNPGPTDVRKAVNNTLEGYHARAQSKGVDLLVEFDANTDVPVLTDAKIIWLALKPIVDNAVKFTNEGRIRVISRIVKEKKKSFLRISVTDSGIGIPKQELRPVFNRFHQVDNGRKRVFQGLGLGLTSTHNLLRQIGGRITVKSTENKGSQFTLYFPVSAVRRKDIKAIKGTESEPAKAA